MRQSHGDSGAESPSQPSKYPPPRAAKHFGVFRPTRIGASSLRGKSRGPQDRRNTRATDQCFDGDFTSSTPTCDSQRRADFRRSQSATMLQGHSSSHHFRATRVFAYNFVVDENQGRPLRWSVTSALSRLLRSQHGPLPRLSSLQSLCRALSAPYGSTSIRSQFFLADPERMGVRSLDSSSARRLPSPPAAAFKNPSSSQQRPRQQFAMSLVLHLTTT